MADALVLCYHAVSPTWGVDISVTPAAFQRQIGYMVRSGWRFVTFSEAVLTPSAPRTLAITFDDAFASVKTYAAPALARHGVPATVFVPTTYVTQAAPMAWDGLEHWERTVHAPELTPMSWDDLGELARAGWEIGSHTCTHPHLTELDDESVRSELERSRADCQERLEQRCESVAYPYGHVDHRVAAHASAAGYRTGAAMSPRLESWGSLRVPRTGAFHGDGDLRFRVKVARPMRVLRASSLWPRG
jgi:peptidoglycan/xylan/chitin deacetylase (PgdA/CDA1 family)